jgi:hypothetical protein
MTEIIVAACVGFMVVILANLLGYYQGMRDCEKIWVNEMNDFLYKDKKSTPPKR